MSEFHKVRDGETLASISHIFGFGDLETIWQHPENDKLRQLRKNPQVLLAGDVLFIPDKQTKALPLPANARHTLSVRRLKLSVRVALQSLLRKPVANVPCLAEVDGVSSEVTSDSNGEVEINVKPTSTRLKLTVGDEERVLNIGALDPVEEVAGQQARLANLGYFHGEIGDTANRDEMTLALSLFQADEDLEVSGKLDDATLTRLVEVHGS
jgi:hypothetical protein